MYHPYINPFRRFCGIFFIVAIMASVVPGCADRPAEESTKPNILLILTDDQGYHDVSYYGTKDLATPHIDKLCGEGMRFDNFYANCPVCSPTRAALLTGKYPDQVGVPGVIRTHAGDNWGFLDPASTLLPARLKEAGYHTALVGKWHLGLESPNTPNDHGFDFFHGWLGDMMDDYNTHLRHDINYLRKDAETIDPPGHATDLFTEWAVDYIRDRSSSDEPFFLYLAYNAPHTPVQPTAKWLERVNSRNPEIDQKRAELVAFIEHMDDGIGKVLAALKETGEYENTLVVFTSDNGGHLPSQANNGPMRNGKGTMYEGGLRVPACVSWPGRIEAGSVSDQVNLSMDLFPTLLDAAGVEKDYSVSGRSFYQTLLTGKYEEEERPLYFIRREGGQAFGGQCSYAVRLGDWKLVKNTPYDSLELYHLGKDPLEADNVVKAEPAVFGKLNKILMEHIQKGGRVPWQDTAARGQ